MKNVSQRISQGNGNVIGSPLLKTGQTTSYRTGDDGDLEKGAGVDFLTLIANNPFGNTNRFTDELGGQTYTNDIVIDWDTYDAFNREVLGYYRVFTTDTWNNAIDDSLTLSISTFTTGWRLLNRNELENLTLIEGATGNLSLNYTPFNYTAAFGIVWTSSTRPDDTTHAFNLINNSRGTMSTELKTNSNPYISCRNFTMTELGF